MTSPARDLPAPRRSSWSCSRSLSLSLSLSARAQVNDIQDFRLVSWLATPAAEFITNPQWLAALNFESHIWFGEDEDGAGIDSACGVRTEVFISETFSSPSICQAPNILPGEEGMVRCLYDLQDWQFESGRTFARLFVRANNVMGVGTPGVVSPGSRTVVFDVDNPIFTVPELRSMLVNAASLRIFLDQLPAEGPGGVVVPGFGLGTHLDEPNGVVAPFECDAYRAMMNEGGYLGEVLPCHLPFVVSDAALLPGLETTCQREGPGSTCSNGRCTGPPQPECFDKPDGELCSEGPGARCQDGSCSANICFLQADNSSCGQGQVCLNGQCTANPCEERPDFSACDLWAPAAGFCIAERCIPGSQVCDPVFGTPEGFLCGAGVDRVCRSGVCQPEACPDGDGDQICDELDNCPILPNLSQADADGDGFGDACDPCPLDNPDDTDLDGVCDSVDNCPEFSNPAQLDTDGEGTGDLCEPIRYAALGDSYSSGEGVPPYFPPTDGLPFIGNRCHRSIFAYSQLLDDPSAVFGREDRINLSKRMDPFEDFLACSGSMVENVTADPAVADPAPPERAHKVFPDNQTQLNRLRLDSTSTVVGPDTDLVTITIGGNDLGFVPVLIKCMTEDCTVGRADLLAAVGPGGFVRTRVRGLMEEIRGRAPNAAVVFAGYPLLFSGETCLGAALISLPEQGVLREVGLALNQMYAEEAAAAGVHFVEDIPARFEGHLVCDEEPWVFGLSLPLARSMHPNRRGQAEYADAINDHLTVQKAAGSALTPKGLPANPPPDPSAAPGAGGGAGPSRSFRMLEAEPLPQVCVVEAGRVARGQTVRLRAEGLAPGSQVELAFLQPDREATALAAATADDEGVASAEVQVPETAAVGVLAGFRMVGVDAGGQPVEFYSDLFEMFDSGESDADGDGVPDVCDVCPDHPDSQQVDSDSDGVGDACDRCPTDPHDDTDGDGLCDDVDPDPLRRNLTCADGIDNDGDGLVDLEDPGCLVVGSPREDPECNDGLDNDGDGLTDLADPGCGGQAHRAVEAPACQDGIDNDGDGLVDLADPGCGNTPVATLEAPACSDGLDNDGDGKVDLDDGDCSGPEDTTERRRSCGLGFEVAAVLWLLSALRRRGRESR